MSPRVSLRQVRARGEIRFRVERARFRSRAGACRVCKMCSLSLPAAKSAQSRVVHNSRRIFCIAKRAGCDRCGGEYTPKKEKGTKQRGSGDHLIAAVHTHRWAGNEAETGRRSRQRRTPTEAAGRASRKGPGSRSSRTDPERTGQALRCGAATSSGDVRVPADRCREETLDQGSNFSQSGAAAGAASERE